MLTRSNGAPQILGSMGRACRQVRAVASSREHQPNMCEAEIQRAGSWSAGHTVWVKGLKHSDFMIEN